jgi:chitinase
VLTNETGSIVRPHTDITELYNNLKPLWFDGVDPAKINLGLAYYGRTYKLADASCGTMNSCKFTGPGAAGECTAFEGVLSNREIRAMVDKGGYKPYFNKTAMVKYMTYAGDSWVGFDDSETIAMKEDFANSMCLGGTMVWSVDFDASVGAGGGSSGGGGGSNSSDTNLIWVSAIHTIFPHGN